MFAQIILFKIKFLEWKLLRIASDLFNKPPLFSAHLLRFERVARGGLFRDKNQKNNWNYSQVPAESDAKNLYRRWIHSSERLSKLCWEQNQIRERERRPEQSSPRSSQGKRRQPLERRRWGSHWPQGGHEWTSAGGDSWASASQTWRVFSKVIPKFLMKPFSFYGEPTRVYQFCEQQKFIN